MAELYFDIEADGTGNGSTWGNRAWLLDGSGNWNPLLVEHDFNAEGMRAYIGAGEYPETNQHINGSRFTTAPPTRENPILMIGVDRDGVILQPPSEWTAARPAWDVSGMPRLKLPSMSSHHFWLYMLAVEATAATAGITASNGFKASWCHLTASNTNSGVNAAGGHFDNCVIRNTSGAYQSVVALNSNGMLYNCRIEGNLSATAGDRHGVMCGSNARHMLVNSVIFNNHGHGVAVTGSGGNTIVAAMRCISRDNGGHGFYVASDSTTILDPMKLIGCIAVENGGYGFSIGTQPGWIIGGLYRGNNSGTADGLGNGGVFNAIESVGNDADEFVDADNGDFRNKYGSVIWGKGIGVEDEPAPAVSGGGQRWAWGA